MKSTQLPKIILQGPASSNGSPLYECEMEADYAGTVEFGKVVLVKAPASVRTLSLRRRPVPQWDDTLERPFLLRVSGRVRNLVFADQEEGFDGDDPYTVIATSESSDDGPWQGVQEAQLPYLRLIEGEIVSFIRPGSDLGKFLQLTRGTRSRASLLGTLPCTLDPTNDALRVTITPAGIEFQAEVPIPAPLAGVQEVKLRLSWDPNSENVEQIYQLELVDGIDPRVRLTDFTAKLARAFGTPRQQGAPLEFDFNSTVEVAPVSWPLVLKSDELWLHGAQRGGGLGPWTAWKARLDGSVLRNRIHTNIPHRRIPEASLAEIHAAVVLVELNQGSVTASAVSDRGATLPSLACTWTPQEGKWTSSVIFPGQNGIDIFIDTEPLERRLLPLYRRNRVWDEGGLEPESDPTPHAFLPVSRGWLQYKLPEGRYREIPQPVEDALAGEIYVVIDDNRSLQIVGAVRAGMGAKWDADGDLVSVFFSADSPQGTCSGYLYLAEASPDSFDALPNLQSGPIASRDVAVAFGPRQARRLWSGKLQTTDLLVLEQPDIENCCKDPSKRSYLWRPATRLPLIPNLPLTNGPAASGRASVTRGLFPGQLTKTTNITFTYSKGSPLPEVAAVTTWPKMDDLWDAASLPLNLPTLPGVEFHASGSETFTGALRFDLPILDELFATTTLPHAAKPEDASSADEAIKPGVIPSALKIGDLAAKVWEPNQRKLALARTDKPTATGPRALDPAAPVIADIASLVEPFTWQAPFGVYAKPNPPIGSYLLDGTMFWAEEAAQGMPNRRFRVNNGTLVADAQGKVIAKNFAVDLIDNTELVQDSRGFQIARVAVLGPSGIVVRYVIDSAGNKWRWATATRPFQLTQGKMGPRSFWFRDLAFAPDQWKFDGLHNPVEDSSKGQDGQAFRPASIAQALHEWRFYTPDSNRYDLRFNSVFRIWPLRLSSVELDGGGDGAPKTLQVLVRVDLQPVVPAQSAPFGVDDANGFGNEVTLDAIAGTLSAATLHFRDTFCWSVKPIERSCPFLSSLARIAATLIYEMPSGEDGSLKGKWSISFDFAGERVQLVNGTFQDGQIQFGTFGPDELKIGVTVDPINRHLTLSPALALVTSGKKETIRWKGQSVTWFGLSVPTAEKTIGLNLDAGTLMLQFESKKVDGAFEIVPGIRIDGAYGAEIHGALQVVTGKDRLHTLYAEVWCTDSKLNITHRMVLADPSHPVLLDQMLITGRISLNSRIEWPDAVLTPSSDPSVAVTIPQSDSTWTHSFTIFLNRHEYPLGRFASDGSWDFDAPVRHTLSRGNDTFSWEALDRISILNGAALRTRVESRRENLTGFLPLRKNPRYTNVLYRGIDVSARIYWGGIAAGDLASSGLWDHDLSAAFESLTGNFVLGGGLTLFSNRLPLLWQYAAPTTPTNTSFPLLRQRYPSLSTSWTLSAPDAPVTISAEERDGKTTSVGVPTEMQLRLAVEAQKPPLSPFEQWLAELKNLKGTNDGASGTISLQPEWVEQIFFESASAAEDIRVQRTLGQQKVDVRGQKKTIVPLEATPFFLGSLLAIQRIRQEKATALWSLRLSEMDPGKCARISVGIHSDTLPPAAPADPQIVVLSSTEKVGIAAVTQSDVLDPPKARLTSVARNLLSLPVAAVLRDETAKRLVVQELLLPVLDVHAPPDPNPPKASVTSPSAALGWPAPVSAQDAVRMNPGIGRDAVTVSAAAGLAGRTASTGWPGYGPDSNHAPWAIYLNSHAPVVFDRPALAVPFQGPMGRHLSPVPTRVRAPLFADVGKALLKLAPNPTPSTGDPLAQLLKRLQPITSPGLERGILGLRPGAFHVVTTSATMPHWPIAPQGIDEKQEAFDVDYSRFGRPASRGPVIAHQVRAPRGTALPRDKEFALRRRTFLSEAEPERLFGSFDGPATVWRFEDSKKTKWRFALQTDFEQSADKHRQRLSAAWKGTVALVIDTAPSANPGDLAAVLKETGLTGADFFLWVGDQGFPFASKDPSYKPIYIDDLPKVKLTLPKESRLGAADALDKAGPDTKLYLRIDLKPANVPTVSLQLPLQFDPPDRPVLNVATTTIAFGDPSYDRQLGSPVQMDTRRIVGTLHALSADRRQYERTGTIYFAFGEIVGGRFQAGADQKVTIERIHAPEGKTEVQQRDRKPGGVQLLSIPDLKLPEGQKWTSGDIVKITCAGQDAPSISLLIVDEPQIAPPPSVYSLVRIGEGNVFADVPLHASGPMPQRIEFPDLLGDLAQGYVRRRALFLWQWSEVKQGGSLTLVKVDRSGGSQIVVPVTLSIQSGELLGTVVGTGTLAVENGLALQAQQFEVAGSTYVNLGSVAKGVYGFTFSLNGDSSSLLAIIDDSGGLTVLDDLPLGTGGPLPSQDLLTKFWSNLTPDLLKAALNDGLGKWVKGNVVGAPLLVVVGFVSGGTAFAIMALSKGSALAATFVTQIASAEVRAGILTSSEANSIKTWATIKNDVLQIPSIITAESALKKAVNSLGTVINVVAENADVKLTATYSGNLAAKYALALAALKK